jgi:hypothetical protein
MILNMWCVITNTGLTPRLIAISPISVTPPGAKLIIYANASRLMVVPIIVPITATNVFHIGSGNCKRYIVRPKNQREFQDPRGI